MSNELRKRLWIGSDQNIPGFLPRYGAKPICRAKNSNAASARLSGGVYGFASSNLLRIRSVRTAWTVLTVWKNRSAQLGGKSPFLRRPSQTRVSRARTVRF